jgi:hypothetical protein
MYEVCAARYVMELVLCAVIGSLVGITAWAMWAPPGKSRFLNEAERLLPLKGRWLRYLVGAALLPLLAAALRWDASSWRNSPHCPEASR